MTTVRSASRATSRAASRAAEKVAAAQEILNTAVAKIQSGEDWRKFLQFQSKLHAYSPRNALLIYVQHHQAYLAGQVPTVEPTAIAGFRTWEALGRHVTKGQHGYTILAPATYRRREAVDATGAVRRLARGEHAAPGETEQSRSGLAGFTTTTVFDVSQTTGDPLPAPPAPQLLAGEAPAGLGAAVLALIERQGYTVDTVPDAGAINGANGQTNWGERTVVVRADMDDAAMVKTLIHEAAHVLLHADLPGSTLPRPLKEVEAESVAFVVAHAHGMPTDEYSFPYVAGWAGEGGESAVLATQARVSRAAQAILATTPAEHLDGGRIHAPARAIETPVEVVTPEPELGVSL